MKKYTVLLVLALFLVLSQLAFGQGPKFGVGGVLALPQGNWSDLTSSIGFGGTAQALLPMGENMAVGAQVGYITFGGEKVVGLDYTISAIPMLAVGRYYLGIPGGPRPFVGALAGFHLMRIEWSPAFLGVDNANSTEFSFGPMGGIEIGGLELVAFYMLISDANYLGARIGFNFGGL